ncbi:MAG: HEAT repeat domain-containing protein [Gemmataceae bacterium]
MRVEAVLALGIVGKAGSAGVDRRPEGQEADVRLNAVATLGKITDEATDAVKPLAAVLAGDRSPDVRVQAANVLGKFGVAAAPALPALEKAAKDDNANVREAATEALASVRAKGKQ